MEFHMKKIILAALAVVAFGAQAADEGAYAGLNYNNAKLSVDGESDSTNTIGVFGGYRMGNIAGEISRMQKTNNGVKFIYTDFAVIPRVNVAKDVDVLGKVGLRNSEISEGTFKASGNSLVLGAGVEFAILPQVTLRAMLDYSNKTFGESIKATTTTIGVAYKF
jgi:outer membrane autotransporter protein